MIAALVITIAGVAMVLVVMLALRLRTHPAEATLQQHRSRGAGLADLLNYAAVVDDGIVVGKNGSFLAAWLYQGDDNATHEAVAHLNTYRKKWRQKIRGFFDQVFHSSTGPVDQDAVAMVNDAEAAIADVNSGVVAQGYYTSVVVLMDEDRHRLGLAAQQIEKTINRLGFAARVETINTMDAYLGSLPGHGVENVRRPIVNTMNLADLLPVSTIWTGEDKAPCPMYPSNAPALMHGVTQGATPFRRKR